MQLRSLMRGCVVSLSLLGLSAQLGFAEPVPSPPPAPPRTPVTAQPAGITEELSLEEQAKRLGPEYTEFALAYEKAVLNSDTAAMNSLIDWNAVLAKVTEKVDADPAFRKGFEDSALESLKTNGLGVRLAQAVKQGATFKLLRVHVVDGQPRALYRFVMAQGGGVNYHDMLLTRNAAGKI